MIYDNLKKNNKNIREINNNVLIHFINGPFVEVKGPKQAKYKVDFINNKTGGYRWNRERLNGLPLGAAR